jgi:hypothetical protein
MNFGKIAFGALVLAIGVVLLAIRMGWVPPDTPLFLIRFWPVLLIAFGLAFLAGAIKNPLLGSLAVLLILGGVALGIFWMNQGEMQGKASFEVGTIHLDEAPPSLSVRVRTFMSSFYIGGGVPRSKALTIRVRTFAADSAVGYRFVHTGKGRALLEWPLRPGWLGLAPLGTSLDIRVPETLPVNLSWRGRFASTRADLTRLKPTRCEFDGIASSIQLGIRDSGRPEEIRIGGFASSVLIRIYGDCPVRLGSRSPFVMRSLPSDFMELALGRGKDKVYAVEGRGAPVRILVDGPFTHIKIERIPSTAALTREDSEWPEPEGTASRSHSPSS